MADRLKLEGVFTALITPFTEDTNSIDYAAFEKVVDLQISGGVSGLVPIGTTGESPTLSSEEKKKLISICVQKAKACTSRKIVVIAGTGSNNTASTVAATKEAKALGVDAVLVVNPYYNKPSQAGVIAHIKAVNEVGIPIVLYNIPGRTCCTLSVDTMCTLFTQCKNVVAVKESTGTFDTALQLASRSGIQILSGDDTLTIPLRALGATGVVSVLANYQPEAMVAQMNKDMGKSLEAAKKYEKLMRNMFIETNPVPVKFAMCKSGIIPNCKVRLPLFEMDPSNQEKLQQIIAEYGLTKSK